MPKLNKFFSKLSRWLLPTAALLLIFVVLSEPTLAAESATAKGFWDMSLGWLASLFSFIIMLITLIAYVFALLVGDLLDSTYILDSGMGDTLHLIWTVMRNFVNVGFILLLLVIAAMVIFGGGGEKGLGMLKKVLPKFILALVFVNLTFFAGRFILTTNDVLATAIFSLPKTVSGDKMIRIPCKAENWEACQTEIVKKVKGTLASGKNEKNSPYTKDKVVKAVEALSKDGHMVKIDEWVGKKNIALVLISSMLDLQNLVYTKGVITGGLADVAIGGIMAMITAGAIGIIIFMLLLALVVRMVVLWLCLAVSPVAALAMVLGDIIPGANMKGDFDLMSIFIKHAFMPTMVAIPLSIGLIMIFANNAVGYDYQLGTLFSFADSEHSGDFHTLLWWIASIAIIWIGTKKMIDKSSDFAKKATDGIHNGVNKFVGAAAGTLKYAPILPAFGGQSMSGLMRQPELLQSHFREKSEAGAQRLANTAGYGSESGQADSKIYQFTAQPNQENFKNKILKDASAARRILEGVGEGARQAQYAFLRAVGYEESQIGERDKLNPTEVAKILAKTPEGQNRIPGYESGQAIKKALEEAVKKQSSPEAAKKQTVDETGVESKAAGQKVEAGKVTGATQTNIKINNHRVFKKDDKYYFADDNKDVGEGGTLAFTEAELGSHLKDLKFDVQEAKDAKEADALGRRIKKAIDTFGDKAFDQLKGLKFGDDKVKEALVRRLREQHQLKDEVLKKLGIME